MVLWSVLNCEHRCPRGECFWRFSGGSPGPVGFIKCYRLALRVSAFTFECGSNSGSRPSYVSVYPATYVKSCRFILLRAVFNSAASPALWFIGLLRLRLGASIMSSRVQRAWGFRGVLLGCSPHSPILCMLFALPSVSTERHGFGGFWLSQVFHFSRLSKWRFALCLVRRDPTALNFRRNHYWHA